MLKQFVKSLGDFEGPCYLPLKRGELSVMFLFLQKVGFFEFVVHGKYSEVGGGNLKKCKSMEN